MVPSGLGCRRRDSDLEHNATLCLAHALWMEWVAFVPSMPDGLGQSASRPGNGVLPNSIISVFAKLVPSLGGEKEGTRAQTCQTAAGTRHAAVRRSRVRAAPFPSNSRHAPSSYGQRCRAATLLLQPRENLMTKSVWNSWFAGSVVLFLIVGSIRARGQDHPPRRDKCTTIIVGRQATTDNSVLLGHNEDWGKYEIPLRWNPREMHKAGETLKLRDGQVIPQVEQAFAFIWPAATCNGINEFQVAITDNTGSCRKELFQKVRGIEMQELVQLVLQRSRTAREAVETMGRLIDQCGYLSVDGPNGDIFSVADPTEGWWMEVTTAGHWVAQRVPDDAFVVLANQFRIGAVDLADSARFLACSNLTEFATERGWHDPEQGDFIFSRAYGNPKEEEWVGSSKRVWRGNCLLSGRTLSPEANPVFLVPTRKLTPRDIMALLRDHYEGSPPPSIEEHARRSLHDMPERPICIMRTDASTVVHLRGWLPHEIGGVIWFAAGTPCSSAYIPFYVGVLEFPEPYRSLSERYSPHNAFWVFNSLENLVDRFYAEKADAEQNVAASVAAFWRRFEEEAFASQAAVEKTALEVYHQDPRLARSFLTRHSGALGLQAFTAAQDLADTLRTKHYR